MTTNNTNLEQGDKPDIKDSVGFKNNSVRVLRDYQRQFSTREFKARGYLLKRGESCLLAERKCVCDY